MSKNRILRTGGLLTVGLALAMIGGSLTVAVAQDTPSEEAAPREGSWVDIAFGTEVDPVTRELLGEAAVFPADGNRVYCYTRVHGLHPPTTVTHAWYYEGKTMAKVELTVRSENWRTWSYKTYQPAWTGNWEVKVLDPDGMVLGSAGFKVE